MRMRTRLTLTVLLVATGFSGCNLSPNVDIPSVTSGDGDIGDGDAVGSGGTAGDGDSTSTGGDSGNLTCGTGGGGGAGGAGGASLPNGDAELVPNPDCEDLQ